MGHVRMMAACQPFLSGAISKTVNLPEDATVEEVEEVYYQGWKMGLKALAVYRDNCKVGQPLSDGKAKKKDAPVAAEAIAAPVRKRLPKSRPATTTSFSVGGAEGYMTAGAYEDGALGEVFLKLGKQGSTLAGVMDAFSIAVSIGLQYGVPLETFVEKFTNLRFEPAGMTDDKDIRMAQSMMDYIFRRLALDYLPFEQRSAMGLYTVAEREAALNNGGEYAPVASVDTPKAVAPVAAPVVAKVETPAPVAEVKIEAKPTQTIAPTIGSSSDLLESMGIKSDAPLCMTCGVKMRMSGACFVCEGCGNTSGCS
jgi:ribonucleoside-diphosphate reductase alpha chain